MSNTSPSSSSSLQLSGPVYDQLKRVATVALPAIGTLYFTLAQIWGLPAAEEVVGTIAAVNLFVGALVNISSKSYNADAVAGTINVLTTDTGGKRYSLDLNGEPEDIEGKSEVRFTVNNPD